MQKVSGRLICTLMFPLVFLGSRPTEASRIDIGEFSDSGGTIINDGSGDVSSSNGSSHGATSLMSDLGLLNPTLAGDLANLHILGIVTDSDLQAVSADLSVLRIMGTVASPCAAALNCAQMSSVRVGGSLSLNNGQDPVNVLFAFNVIGGALLNMPWGTTPGGLPTQSVQNRDASGLPAVGRADRLHCQPHAGLRSWGRQDRTRGAGHRVHRRRRT